MKFLRNIFCLLFTLILSIQFVFANNRRQFIEQKSASLEYQKTLDYLSKNKIIISKMLMLSDYYESYFELDDRKTLFKEIKHINEKYKNNKNSFDYKYAQMALSLYLDIIKYSQKNIVESVSNKNFKDKIIEIPDYMYDKLDKNLREIIIELNTIANYI